MEKIQLSDEQEEAVKTALSGRNMFLTGKAGTGKSTCLREIVKRLKDRGRNVVKLGTTGIAALNVEGATMHSFFSIPIKRNGVIIPDDCHFVKGDKRKMWQRTHVVIIDEVSMLRADVLDAIEWTLNKNGGQSLLDMQIIFVGDLKQLPPVVTEVDNFQKSYKDEFLLSSYVWGDLNVQEVYLKTVHRQKDPEYLNNLNKVRETGKTTPYFDQFKVSKDDHKGIVLCPYRATVDEYNRRRLARVSTNKRMYFPKTEGNIDLRHYNIPDKLTLKSGARVMSTYNNKDKGLANGSIGTLRIEEGETELNDKLFFVFDGEEKKEVSIETAEFKKTIYVYNEKTDSVMPEVVGRVICYPLSLAYALTIHKSQGLTFSEMTVDLNRGCFVDGQLYVALSRATGPEALNLIY